MNTKKREIGTIMVDKFRIDFIGIGTAKSGTTWLVKQLNEHPSIYIPSEKELHFFSVKDSHGFDLKNNRYEKFGFEWYENHFRKCDARQVRGEFTPFYLYCGTAAHRIFRHAPNVRLICTLREPIQRAFSHYQHDMRIGLLNSRISFENAVRIRRDYLEYGLYYKYLKVYFDIFPHENIKIIFFEDIAKNPLQVIEELYNFLDVNSDYIPETLFKKENVKGNSRFPRLNELLMRTKYLLRKKDLSFIIKLVNFLKISDVATHIINLREKDNDFDFIERPNRDKYLSFFLSDTVKLENLLSIDLSKWKR